MEQLISAYQLPTPRGVVDMIVSQARVPLADLPFSLLIGLAVGIILLFISSEIVLGIVSSGLGTSLIVLIFKAKAIPIISISVGLVVGIILLSFSNQVLGVVLGASTSMLLVFWVHVMVNGAPVNWDSCMTGSYIFLRPAAG